MCAINIANSILWQHKNQTGLSVMLELRYDSGL